MKLDVPPAAVAVVKETILVTGCEGLIGSALVCDLAALGVPVVGLDLAASNHRWRGDVRRPADVAEAVASCRGVVHLAAVSRVIWAERDPALCASTNVGGLRTVLDTASSVAEPPWVIFASSREVYGQAARLPADEDTPLAPLNVYGRSKVAGERLIAEASAAGLRAAVVRLSNVYGRLHDHPDRVVPAFAQAALRGGRLRVDGAHCTFDFTHVDDTVRGLCALIELLDHEAAPPPIHLLTGHPTTLGALARQAVLLSGSCAEVVTAAPRAFDVPRFYGDPARAKALLGWQAQIAVRDGLARLIGDLRGAGASAGLPDRRQACR